ncbi:hypothetical protein T06_9848 [Trichinella sp. T6]|nr:hypothetical protein T06_9848 [Trichinella sp. T6]
MQTCASLSSLKFHRYYLAEHLFIPSHDDADEFFEFYIIRTAENCSTLRSKDQIGNVTNPVGVTPPAPMVLYGRGRRKNNTRIPSTRSSSRHMAALMGSERPRALTLTDGNGCLRRCAGCASTKLL